MQQITKLIASFHFVFNIHSNAKCQITSCVLKSIFVGVYEISLPFLEQRGADASRALEFKNEHAEPRERPFNTQTSYFCRFKGKQLVQTATGRAALIIFGSLSLTCNCFTLSEKDLIIHAFKKY